jgi:uncharacterized protein YdhG (YjbR/CyaY superfamily)
MEPDGMVETVDDYIAHFPEPVRENLRTMRAIIRDEAPEATEGIGYGMASYKLNGNLMHFAAFAKHIGLYGAYPDDGLLQETCAPYLASKGTLQFRHDKDLPVELIRELVRRRAITQRG